MIYWKFKIYESVNMVGKMGLCVLAKFNYYLIQVSVSIDICYLILIGALVTSRSCTHLTPFSLRGFLPVMNTVLSSFYYRL